jgi:hypothetical protein
MCSRCKTGRHQLVDERGYMDVTLVRRHVVLGGKRLHNAAGGLSTIEKAEDTPADLVKREAAAALEAHY